MTSSFADVFMLQSVLWAPTMPNVVWSLAYEMVFYLMLTALFLGGVHRRSGRYALAFAAAAVGLGGILVPGLLSFVGTVPYRYGGSSPSSGFDCSGLTSYVYRHFGKSIPRTADAQFRRFRRESESRAWGGDLVFFHVNSNPNSYVYHVGIYEGGHHMVAATHPGGGIRWQTIYSRNVTFGTITH